MSGSIPDDAFRALLRASMRGGPSAGAQARALRAPRYATPPDQRPHVDFDSYTSNSTLRSDGDPNRFSTLSRDGLEVDFHVKEDEELLIGQIRDAVPATVTLRPRWDDGGVNVAVDELGRFQAHLPPGPVDVDVVASWTRLVAKFDR